MRLSQVLMRFELRTTKDGSITVFDQEAGECFKSQHAARLEVEQVFFRPAVLENPWYGKANSFRVLELGLGLGTNCLHFSGSGFRGEFLSIERDLAGAEFFLKHSSSPALAALIREKQFQEGGMGARLLVGDFTEQMNGLLERGELFHAVLFDPFSPKANPEAWAPGMFALAYRLLVPGGRLVTYSVSRTAKDSAAEAGFIIEKHKLSPLLNKRSALLAVKPLNQ